MGSRGEMCEPALFFKSNIESEHANTLNIFTQKHYDYVPLKTIKFITFDAKQIENIQFHISFNF